jgi:aromatic-L-amino-acid/L-tryptophan decarboxylase
VTSERRGPVTVSADGGTDGSETQQPVPDGLDAAQGGLGDMGPEDLRAHGHAVIDWIADYLEHVGERPVLAPVQPGDVRSALPASPPEAPEPFAAALRDLDDVILPGITHWNHPSFHAYFSITGSGPGILGEALAAALNVNGMLWRTSPSATELEEVATDWVRQLLGLPEAFRGIICDTASLATMLALAAAREQADLDVRQRGLAGRTDVPLLRVYTSEQAHSSVEKAAIALGLGRDGVRAIPTDAAFRMSPAALEDAIREDLRFGYRPIAIVPTVGTTSTTSIDPVARIIEVRDAITEELGIPVWVHVDAAYGGMLAVCQEHRAAFAGVDAADSVVTNPHKWLFTPIDCSVLLVREPATLTRAFSLVPEYLVTDDEGVTDYMDWGVQLGRRFRALKLWMVIRYFGRSGITARVRHQLAQARRVRAWVEQHPALELAAPVPMSTVCFRARPTASQGEAGGPDEDAARALNRRWLDAVNRSGDAYLSHTELDGRYVLRLAIGNLRTTDERLDATLAVLERELATLLASRGEDDASRGEDDRTGPDGATRPGG